MIDPFLAIFLVALILVLALNEHTRIRKQNRRKPQQ